MTDRLVITLDAEGELQRRLGQLLSQLQDPDALLSTLGARLEANVQQRFDYKLDPAGQPWAQLRPSTVRAYAARTPPVAGTLLDRGQGFGGGMRGTLAVNVLPGAVEVGFSAPYAKYHEYGTKRMVRRGLLSADPEAGRLGDGDRQDVLDELEAFLVASLRG